MTEITMDSRATMMSPMARTPGLSALLDGAIPTPAILKAASQPSAMELQNVASYVSKNAQAENNDIDTSRPQLTKPAGTAAEQIANGESDISLFGLIAQLEEIFGNDSVEEMKSRLAVFEKFAAARQANIEKTSQAFIEAQKTLDAAVLHLDNMTSQLDQAQSVLTDKSQIVDAAKARYDKAELTVQKAQAALNAAPNDPAAKQALVDARQYLQQQQQQLGQAQAQMALAQGTYDKASTTTGDALDATNAALGIMTQRAAELEDGAPVPIFNPIKEAESAVRVMFECMLRLQDIIAKDNQAALENRMNVFKLRQEMLLVQLEKDAKAYTAAQESAKRTGWIGTVVAKVVGWVLVALGVVTAAISGGIGGLALATLGFTVMVADEILADLKITTITQAIMGPIMENVVMKFIQVIAEAITKSMVANGVDPKTAAIVANVVAALTAVVTIVVGVALGSAAIASDFVASIAKGVTDNIMKKLPDSIREFTTATMKQISSKLSSMSTTMTEGFQKVAGGPEGIKLLLNRLETAQSALVPILLTVENALSLKSTKDREKMLLLFADITMYREGLKSTKKQSEDSMQQFISAIKIPHEFNRILAQVMQSNEQTGTHILRLRV